MHGIRGHLQEATVNPQTKNLDFGGFDSSRFLLMISPEQIGFPKNLDSGFLVLWILGSYVDWRIIPRSSGEVIP